MDKDYEYLIYKIAELERRIYVLETMTKASDYEDVSEVNFKVNEFQENRNSRKERYVFEGRIYKKSRLVQAVIKKYVEINPGTTIEQLLEAFPSDMFHMSYDCVMDLSKVPEKYIKPVKRYFVDDPITLEDGTNIVVCTQWGTNTKDFIDYVIKKYGFVIEPVY